MALKRHLAPEAQVASNTTYLAFSKGMVGLVGRFGSPTAEIKVQEAYCTGN